MNTLFENFNPVKRMKCLINILQKAASLSKLTFVVCCRPMLECRRMQQNTVLSQTGVQYLTQRMNLCVVVVRCTTNSSHSFFTGRTKHMNKKEAFNIAFEVASLASLAAIGEVALMECESIIKGLVKSSTKVLDELNNMKLTAEVIELFGVVGIKLGEKE